MFHLLLYRPGLPNFFCYPHFCLAFSSSRAPAHRMAVYFCWVKNDWMVKQTLVQWPKSFDRTYHLCCNPAFWMLTQNLCHFRNLQNRNTHFLYSPDHSSNWNPHSLPALSFPWKPSALLLTAGHIFRNWSWSCDKIHEEEPALRPGGTFVYSCTF